MVGRETGGGEREREEERDMGVVGGGERKQENVL